jgi:hypothetical protein
MQLISKLEHRADHENNHGKTNMFSSLKLFQRINMNILVVAKTVNGTGYLFLRKGRLGASQCKSMRVQIGEMLEDKVNFKMKATS